MKIAICISLILAGCAAAPQRAPDIGRLDRGLYRQAREDNEARLGGEEYIPKTSPVLDPLNTIATESDKLIGQPLASLFHSLTHDTPGLAARQMEDPDNPDLRRAGTLRLVDYPKFRKGPALTLYAAEAANQKEDFTVRAAGLRALNRCRAHGFTGVLLLNLDDKESSLVRLEAAKALANIPDPHAVPSLLAHLSGDGSADVRLACADALRNYQSLQVAHALIGVLADPDFSVSWQARQSLLLLTGHDFKYDEKAWLSFLSNHPNPFGA